jgi:hypothetical protein
MPLWQTKVVLKDKNFRSLFKGLKGLESEPEIADAWVRVQAVYKAYLRRRFNTRSRSQGTGGIGRAWPPLALSTIKQRRPALFKKPKAKKKKVVKAKKPTKPAKRKKLTIKNVVSRAKKARKATSKAVKSVKKKVKAVKTARKKAAKKAKAIRKLSILRDTGAMFAVFQPEILNVTGVLTPQNRAGLHVKFGGYGSTQDGTSLDKLLYWHHNGSGRLPARTLIVGLDQATAKTVARIFESAMKKIAARAG